MPRPLSVVRQATVRHTPLTRVDRARAMREIAAHFERPEHSGLRLVADSDVEAALQAIPAYLLGALSLCHDERVWPASVSNAFGDLTALAIRLYCADHPAQGSTKAQEAAAATHLEAIITAQGSYADMILDLGARADRYRDRALAAYANERANRDATRRAGATGTTT